MTKPKRVRRGPVLARQGKPLVIPNGHWRQGRSSSDIFAEMELTGEIVVLKRRMDCLEGRVSVLEARPSITYNPCYGPTSPPWEPPWTITCHVPARPQS